MLKQISLGANATVHNIIEKGDFVKNGDVLLEFTSSFDDPATSEFLANIAKSMGDDLADVVGNEQVKSKYTGRIADIKIYYNVPTETLSPTLKSLIRKYKGKIDKRKMALTGIKSNIYIPPLDIQKSDKVGQTKYEGILIEIYTEYYDDLSEGDKIVFNTALKSIVSQKVATEESPISTYRPEEVVEAVLTPTGVNCAIY